MHLKHNVQYTNSVLHTDHEHAFDICNYANINNVNFYKFEFQTDEMCLYMVKKYYGCLGCVKNQTEEICLAAVKKNGYALRYVKKSNSIELESMDALLYVENQTKNNYNIKNEYL